MSYIKKLPKLPIEQYQKNYQNILYFSTIYVNVYLIALNKIKKSYIDFKIGENLSLLSIIV